MNTHTAHTPGPWIVSNVPTIENDLTSWHVFSPIRNGYVIARTGKSNIDETLREAEANARLIAAAPELLTALTGLLATAEFVDAGNKRHGEDRYGFAQSLFEQCRAVIAKATIEPLKP